MQVSVRVTEQQLQTVAPTMLSQAIDRRHFTCQPLTGVAPEISGETSAPEQRQLESAFKSAKRKLKVAASDSEQAQAKLAHAQGAVDAKREAQRQQTTGDARRAIYLDYENKESFKDNLRNKKHCLICSTKWSS